MMISNIVLDIVFFLLGTFLDFLNNLCLKKTIDIFLKSKNRSIITLVFLMKLLVFLILFIIISSIRIRGLYFTLLGLVVSKFVLLLNNCVIKKK